jgi:hypothetical protein
LQPTQAPASQRRPSQHAVWLHASPEPAHVTHAWFTHDPLQQSPAAAHAAPTGPHGTLLELEPPDETDDALPPLPPLPLAPPPDVVPPPVLASSPVDSWQAFFDLSQRGGSSIESVAQPAVRVSATKRKRCV